MKDISLKLFADYPYAFNQRDVQQDNRCWCNFLSSSKNDISAWKHGVDHILDTEYNAIRTTGGLRFKYESDRLMFILRFS